ncbi:uncharacterized protein LOC132294149 isoform X1 [Cornus florida]|uniref:uncharacterized protein LOC132294149 isoform X1 n=1 Tax=Cornus florida TaxID=4283 RepID=UPI0028995C30|nr:uncharacterized protein LOC132294149 isoform X1 [Cornus florida]
MVVCKCRKATKLYCFVHKVPVCGECICFPEHQICVVRTYSEWVIDGEYDWPPKCCLCHGVLGEGTDSSTTRLGCLHTIHTNCLVSHVKSFPPHTAPAGYVCPACSISIWPPKTVKDSGSRLHSKLKEAIMQTGLEKNLLGNHPTESRGPPPAFASNPLIHTSVAKDAEGYLATAGIGSTKSSVTDIVEIDGPSSASPSLSNHDSNFMKSTSPSGPGATTRKNAFQVDKQNSEISYFADDEDGNQKKYTKRGHAWLQWVFCITDLHNVVLVRSLMRSSSDQSCTDCDGGTCCGTCFPDILVPSCFCSAATPLCETGAGLLPDIQVETFATKNFHVSENRNVTYAFLLDTPSLLLFFTFV